MLRSNIPDILAEPMLNMEGDTNLSLVDSFPRRLDMLEVSLICKGGGEFLGEVDG
jgi:hypothetical protein